MILEEGSVTARGNLGVYLTLLSKIKERTMSRKKTDVFTELGHAVLDARHNGTPTERAEASRLTLLGKLPPLPPYVALMTETPWAQVAQVAISPEGKIAVLGIEPDGDKELVEFTVVDRRWTTYVVDGTASNFYVDHLHYPEESEKVAFTVTPKGGITRVFWDDWKFDVPDKGVSAIHCYFADDNQPSCFVVSPRENGQKAQWKRKVHVDGHKMPSKSLADGNQIKILGTFGDRIATLRIREGQKSVSLVDLNGDHHWDSDWYDEIIVDSVMLRNDEFSFVGWNQLRTMGQERSGAFLESTRSKKSLDYDDQSGKIYCLPSGRILIQDGCVDLGWVLHDVNTNMLISLLGVREFSEIVEIPSGLVVRVIKYDGSHALLVIHENWDSVPGLLHAFQADEIRSLRRWGDHLVFEISECGSESIRVVRVEDLEEWLVETNDVRYVGPLATYPLYTPFERLVYTEEGILSWHFVNGTMYIIRYPL
ncbi:hypothetical protein COV05_02085 [Candidatus Uhrbacteria bacterium CG10_big_fil_rev_8_21_14_0_10_48_16]|uniref:Uncharacterized protein n=1 Tax=Candidatus Uhrbacteria bacterium CG10_big_fil_rev_8_21_14_0_10_48_16 TaxID=1975038 RepID=A0A2M8LHN7_9BACT|nr:MAG: hypothetical protein COV05_02085 [Candidatus Uhrbacteria bacterium CG10_big_fil_rev_8_21_14_0_10_48_16]